MIPLSLFPHAETERSSASVGRFRISYYAPDGETKETLLRVASSADTISATELVLRKLLEGAVVNAERTAKAGWLRKSLSWIGAIAVILLIISAIYVTNRYFDDEPVAYADVREHFKYGSTGGERGWKKQFGFGIPYWVWVALPELFHEHLPDGQAGAGYSALGLIYEDGKDPRFDLPVGMSMRRVMGVDRVYFNCGFCHTGSVRDAPGADPRLVLGMPSNTVDLGGLIGFLDHSSKDWRFRPSRLLPKIEQMAELRDAAHEGGDGYRPDELGFVDRQIFQFFGIPMLRDQLMTLLGRLDFMDHDAWGPGRVDTFNAPKALLGFRMEHADESELNGIADFPSVWNQKARKGMWLHWDGNNCSVDERNLSAGFGTGATPPTIDKESMLRVADWLWEDAQPPAFPVDRIDRQLAARGQPIYEANCSSCHGGREAPFRQAGDGSKLGDVTPIEAIGTDRSRLDSYTPALAQAQSSIYAGYPPAGEEACREYFETVCETDQDDERYRELRAQCYPARFRHFRKTWGYANMPLDGLWLRAPYLHNGSVRSLRELLEPAERRAVRFYNGYDVYDYEDVGFVSAGAAAEKRGWLYDTGRVGNGRQGHEGPAYGTELAPAEKTALIEYLKTF